MFKFKKIVPTVAAALAGFEKVRADLKAAQQYHDALAEKHESAAFAADNEANEIIAKAKRAAEAFIAKANEAKAAAESEAREAVKALARFEAILGL